MKKSQLRVLIVLTFMLLVLLFNSFITRIFNQYTLCIFVLLLGFVSYFLVGYEKEKSRYNKDIILSILIYITIYYILTYLLGLFLGFSKNVYSLTFSSIMRNIVSLFILILISELFRYIVNTKIKNNYWLLALSMLSFTMIDVTFTLNAVNFKDFYSILKCFGLFVLPSLGKNFLVTYLSYTVSFKPNIVYRVLMEIPKFILPIIPNFGPYIESVIYVSFPVLVFAIIYNKFKKLKKGIILSEKKQYFRLTYVITIPILIAMVGLTCGYFKYQAIVVATGSMTPNINKGDVVIVKKLTDNEKKDLKKGDVLVFNRGDRIVVHRIYDIYSTGGEIFFKTKGDFNKDPDGYLIETSEVIGTVKAKIKYIGYPTVILYEKFGS